MNKNANFNIFLFNVQCWALSIRKTLAPHIQRHPWGSMTLMTSTNSFRSMNSTVSQQLIENIKQNVIHRCRWYFYWLHSADIKWNGKQKRRDHTKRCLTITNDTTKCSAYILNAKMANESNVIVRIYGIGHRYALVMCQSIGYGSYYMNRIPSIDVWQMNQKPKYLFVGLINKWKWTMWTIQRNNAPFNDLTFTIYHQRSSFIRIKYASRFDEFR